MIKYPAVPVITYHSIGIVEPRWQWNYLTCPYEVFENHLKYMKKAGFHAISLQQLYDYMKKGAKLPKNPVVLTFDDGYLDNWVFAYPLLKKYGFKGTIFVSPEFIDPRCITRKNLANVWDREVEISELQTTGYLSWEELKKMEEEGVMDTQSHTMTHTWYPVSSKVIDFRHPGDPYIWITWNNNPSKKPYLQIDDEALIEYGEPVYEYGRAIVVKRYFPDEELKEQIIEYVKKKGKAFFNSKDWRNELFKIMKMTESERKLNDAYETDEEYEERIYYELQKSKEIIEKKLSKEVKFLSWPGDAVIPKALKISFEVGYAASTAGSDINNIRKHMRNTYGGDPSRINRVYPVLYWDGVEAPGSIIKYMNGPFLLLLLRNFQGGRTVRVISRLILAAARITHTLRMK